MPKATATSTTTIIVILKRLVGRGTIPIGYKTYSSQRRFFVSIISLLIMIVVFSYIGYFVGQENNEHIPMSVVSVTDGDTIKVRDKTGNITTVRLLGVDTPETHHPTKPVGCFGPEAAAFTQKSLSNKSVELEYDQQRLDKYGRTLAYVYIDGVRFNDVLVQQGYAKVLSISPNTRYARNFAQLELDAKNNSRGLWGYCVNDL